MKKYLIILILLINLIHLKALQLTSYYHKNYGIIDRSVFVFDQKPEYFLEEAVDQIKLTVKNCSLKPQVNDLVLENNSVLSSYVLANLEADLKVTINLVRPASELRKYKVDDFLLTGKEYKIVLDIFKYAEPLTETEIKSFIDFYKKVELTKQAAIYEKMLAEWEAPVAEIEQPEQEEITPDEKDQTQTDSIFSETVTEPKLSEPSLLERVQELYKNLPVIYIIIIAALIIILLIIILILCTTKKKPTAKGVFENREKIGSNDFRFKVIKILRQAGWEDNMIAEELGMSQDEVKNTPK